MKDSMMTVLGFITGVAVGVLILALIKTAL